MNLINIFKMRKENKIKENIIRQSKRRECCESCKYCYLASIDNGYDNYKCLLKEIGFEGYGDHIWEYKCGKYSPCRKYKKYLDNLKC